MLEVTFDAPRDVDYVELLPYNDRRGDGDRGRGPGPALRACKPGWNRLRVGLRGVRTLSVRIAAVTKPDGPTAGAGGIRELRIPGVAALEALRVPVLAERALAGRDLSRTGLTYLFQRTTGDDPFRRDPRRGSAGAMLVRDRLDGERGLHRVFAPPAARRWLVDGWASAAADAPDSALDRLAGVRGVVRVLRPLPGPPGVPGLERVRRHGPAVDRLVAGRPERLAGVDGAAADHDRAADARPGARACGGRRRCGSWPTAGHCCRRTWLRTVASRSRAR